MAVKENFSEDEITYELKRKLIKEKKTKLALQQLKKMEEHILETKFVTMRGMKTLLDTIHQIDENSKKMAYKPFN